MRQLGSERKFVGRLTTVVLATLSAHYGVTLDAAFGMVGLLLGLIGFSICEGFMRMARRRRA